MTIRMVALLRGINVGRSNRVGMAQLRKVLGGLGYTDVATLLQSGNVVFGATPAEARTASRDIADAVAAEFKVECAVIVRSAAEFLDAAGKAPRLADMTDPSRYLVGFLEGEPDAEGVRAVNAIDLEPDWIQVVNRHVYLWAPDGVSATPLTKTGWEKLLGTPVTTRNWRTVGKLADLLNASG
jgi:uncharacterized protein (DUF1697 family)